MAAPKFDPVGYWPDEGRPRLGVGLRSVFMVPRMVAEHGMSCVGRSCFRSNAAAGVASEAAENVPAASTVAPSAADAGSADAETVSAAGEAGSASAENMFSNC